MRQIFLLDDEDIARARKEGISLSLGGQEITIQATPERRLPPSASDGGVTKPWNGKPKWGEGATRVEAVLRQAERPLQSGEIVKRSGVSQSTVYMTIHHLREAKKIKTKTGENGYPEHRWVSDATPSNGNGKHEVVPGSWLDRVIQAVREKPGIRGMEINRQFGVKTPNPEVYKQLGKKEFFRKLPEGGYELKEGV